MSENFDVKSYLLGKASGGGGGGSAPSGSLPITANGTYDVAAYAQAVVNVGDSPAPVVTEDTEVDIELADGWLSLVLSFLLEGTATINWGDGSDPETVTARTGGEAAHTYAAAGDYTIKISVLDGNIEFSGDARNGCGLISTPSYITTPFLPAIRALRIGANATIGNYAFCKLYRLKSVTMHPSITAIGNGAFFYCYGLETVVLSDNITSIGSVAFSDCYGLREFNLPSALTDAGTSALAKTSIVSLTIPEGMETIPSGFCSTCQSLRTVDLTAPKTLVTMANYSALSSTPSDMRILVPAALEADYKAAANWSDYAGQIVGV